MPKYALLSDVHANLQALKAVLAECTSEGITEGFFCGDLVGYAADSSACVRLAKETGWLNTIGNQDCWTLAEMEDIQTGSEHALQEMSRDEIEWLKGSAIFVKPDGAIITHSSLNEPDHWNYVDSQEGAEPGLALLRGRKRHVAFHGHTHVQRVFTDESDARKLEWLDDRLFRIPEGLATVVTVGSVGEPRGNDGDVRAAWATWDPQTRVVEFRRTSYGIGAAA